MKSTTLLIIAAGIDSSFGGGIKQSKRDSTKFYLLPVRTLKLISGSGLVIELKLSARIWTWKFGV